MSRYRDIIKFTTIKRILIEILHPFQNILPIGKFPYAIQGKAQRNGSSFAIPGSKFMGSPIVL